MGDPHEPGLVWDFTTFYKFRDNRDLFRPSIVQVEKQWHRSITNTEKATGGWHWNHFSAPPRGGGSCGL